VAAAASGLVTALVTQRPSPAWWVALGVLVVIGGVLQVLIMIAPRHSPTAAAKGAGAVAVAGNVTGEIRTRVHGMGGSSHATPGGDGVVALGPGAVGVGGNVSSPISTDVTGAEEQPPP
jgi:hypothetical protein